MEKHARIAARDRSVVLVVDLQEAYRGKLLEEDRVIGASERLLRGAGALGIPVLVSEQYPKGLGRTRAEVAEHLPADAERFEKTAFSALGAPGLRERLAGLGRSHVIVAGIETHVCVSQTVHDLLADGFVPHLVRGAITARFRLEDEIGFSKMVGSGAVPTTVEALLFEWLEDARAPEFKEVHGLVK